MCSEKEDRVVSALKSFNHPQTLRSGSHNGSPVARLYCKNNLEYLMRKTRVTVGRTSTKSAADVDMGASTYISRNHLEIYTTESRFYVLVTGKNGVFIDGDFHRKGSAPLELQRMSNLRFPSTDITIEFTVLLEDESYINPVKCSSPLLTENSPNGSRQKPPTMSSIKPASPVSLELVNAELPLTALQPIKQGITVPVGIKAEDAVTKGFSKEPLYADVKEQHKWMAIADDHSMSRDGAKPPYSYAQLIVQAISAQKDRQLTLSGIYSYITKKYPFYRSGDKGWQNSIRHNLSLNRYFLKVPRAQEESGKGSFWKIDPSSEMMLTDQAFKRRRQRTIASNSRTNHGDSTPSLMSMSSTETDGFVTPDDSCMSWEGVIGTAGTDEASKLVVKDQSNHRPNAFHGNGMNLVCDAQGSQAFEESSHSVAAGFMHHALPQLISKPQFFIAKSSGIMNPVSASMVPVQLPATAAAAFQRSNAADAQNVKSNNLDMKTLFTAGDGKPFMLPEKQAASFMDYLQRQQQQIQQQTTSFQQKTVIVRMNPNGSGSFNDLSSSSLSSSSSSNVMRFSYGLPTTTEIETKPYDVMKMEAEEESDEMVSSIESICIPYDNMSSEVINGDRHCIQIRTMSN